MANSGAAVVFCLDIIPERNDLPVCLQCVAGIPALDHLLHYFQSSGREVLIVCRESSYTRYFANYCSVRGITAAQLIAYSPEKLIPTLQKYETLVLFNSNFTFLDELGSGFTLIGNGYMAYSDSIPVLGVFSSTLLKSITTNEISNNAILSQLYSCEMSILNSSSAVPITTEEGWKEADLYYRKVALEETYGLSNVVIEKCNARIGMMGNPSDGFNGKTLSFLIDNFSACVKIEGRPVEMGIDIVEPLHFSRLDDLQQQSILIVSNYL